MFPALPQRQDTSELRLWQAVAVSACNRSGDSSSVAIHDPSVTVGALLSAIQRKAPGDDIRRRAVAGGMTTLPQDGVEKILQGQTGQKQLLAVCRGARGRGAQGSGVESSDLRDSCPHQQCPPIGGKHVFEERAVLVPLGVSRVRAPDR